MGVKLLFAWYDLWVGLYYDRHRRRLYVLPIPCVGVVIQFPLPKCRGECCISRDMTGRPFAPCPLHAHVRSWDDQI